MRALRVGWALWAVACAQSVDVLGPPRWMPVDGMAEARANPVAAAHDKTLRALLERIRALPVLNPPPAVYPKASLSFLRPDQPGQAPASTMMLGFWPPNDVRLTNGNLRPAGELHHLLIYANRVREDAFDRTFWRDARGGFYPQPEQLGDLQGFPIYQGFGASEVSGILVILPPGKALFAPISQERFHLFAMARFEKQIAEAAPALKRARDEYDAAVSAAGRAAREARIAASLASYQQGRTRTPQQVRDRETELRRLDAQEEERLKQESSPETNRLLGPLQEGLRKAQQAYAALTPEQKNQPACHRPHERDSSIPQPVLSGTPGCRPVVTVGSVPDPARPGAVRMLSIERYWSSRENVLKGLDRSARYIYYHLNKEIVEALDWKAVAAELAR